VERFAPPAGLDRQSWIERWDRMQDFYLPKRWERFETIAEVVRGTQDAAPRILDLGCGTGSLSLFLLERIKDSFVCGVDLDPTLLLLAESRLSRFGSRGSLALADLRGETWDIEVPAPFNAAVSATSLHWLNPDQMGDLYSRLPGLLQPGGVFLNADHVGSDSVRIRETWSKIRQAELTGKPADPVADDWDGFWNAYLTSLGPGSRRVRAAAVGNWEGVEEGMPLAWHFDQLRRSGFHTVDCFWRYGGDAIYGGVVSENGRKNAPAD
jgi:SAM-dependent methyltransferase